MSDRDKLPKRILAIGATSAIAEATLRLLAQAGASFFLVGREARKLDAVRDDLLTRGADSAHVYAMDLDNTAAHPAMLEEAVQFMGAIDLALIAHGVLGNQEEAQQDYGVAAAVLHTNFLSAVSLITWLANYFEATRHGTLAVISSVAGDRGRKSNYIYGASKGALSIFLDGVRNRIDRAGVHVLTIKPGFVATPMTAHLPKSGLMVRPATAAHGILRAIQKRKDIAYVPSFWRMIMFAIRSIPEWQFKKMNL